MSVRVFRVEGGKVWQESGLQLSRIISELREAEVAPAQGQSVAQVCKRLGVTEQSYYRWRKEYGGLRLHQAKRLKVLEKENTRLETLVADLSG